MYRQQSYSYSSRLVDPAALQPLLLILGEDARTLRAKLLGLRNSTMKGLKMCNTTLQQVSVALVDCTFLGMVNDAFLIQPFPHVSVVSQLSSAMIQLLKTHRRQSQEIHEVRSLYRREALQRKMLYNEACGLCILAISIMQPVFPSCPVYNHFRECIYSKCMCYKGILWPENRSTNQYITVVIL